MLADHLSEDRFQPLDRDEEVAVAERLRRAIATGNTREEKAIRHMLVERNLRLVMYVGRPYVPKLGREETFSVGALALTRAVERWDPDKGHLYGWAVRWMTTALTRAVDAARPIRIPQSAAHQAAVVQRDIAREEMRIGRPLSWDEQKAVAAGRPMFEDYPYIGSSLDGTPSAEGDDAATLMESIPGDSEPSPEEEATSADLAHRLRSAMRELTPLEQKVVAARFGLDGARLRTLAELGKEHGVSGEAMRRVEASALGKLRHPALNTNLEAQ